MSESDEIINALNCTGGRQVTDPAVQMQTKLSTDNLLVVAIKSVCLTAFFYDCQIDFVVLATERLPSHFNIAVGGIINRRGRRGLFQRNAQRPATQNIPLVDASPRLQADQLFFGLVRDRA